MSILCDQRSKNYCLKETEKCKRTKLEIAFADVCVWMGKCTAINKAQVARSIVFLLDKDFRLA